MGKALVLLIGFLVMGEENNDDRLSRIRKLFDEKTWEEVRSHYEDPKSFQMLQKIDWGKIGTFPEKSAEKFRRERGGKKRPLFRTDGDVLEIPDDGERPSPKRNVNEEEYRFSLRGKVQMVHGTLPAFPDMLTLCIRWPWDPEIFQIVDCDANGNFTAEAIAITPQGDYYQTQPGDKVCIYPEGFPEFKHLRSLRRGTIWGRFSR